MANDQGISGNMLLYERPELLTREEHGHLGLRSLPQPFAFASGVRAVPLMVSEFRSAQRYYPVVFSSNDDNTVPLAILGVGEDRNLLVDAQGQWQVPGYVPAYLRCYPFALASTASERFALVVDRTADMVSDAPEVPFFDGEELSAPVRERLELCRTFQTERERTAAFCERAKRHGLLVEQTATYEVDGRTEPFARYTSVNVDKLKDLDKEVVAELLRDGSLLAMLAQVFSLDNFEELIRLRQQRGPA